mgnify:CR=1 FL=1
MMKLIGSRRVVALALLLGFNLIVAGVCFLMLTPALEASRQGLIVLNAQITELGSKITNTKKEVAYLRDNIPRFHTLEEKGFFLDQDRFMIGRLIDETGKKALLSNFFFAVDDLAEIKNADADKMDHRLVSSRITVKDIDAALDTSVFAFAQDIAAAFPEHTRIQRIDIKRTAEVSEPLLSALSSGKPAGFLRANVLFDWMTLVPKSKPQETGGDATGPDAAGGFRGR